RSRRSPTAGSPPGKVSTLFLRNPAREDGDYLSSAQRGGAGGTAGDRRAAQLGAAILGDAAGDLGKRPRDEAGGSTAARVHAGARRLAELRHRRGEQRARRDGLAEVTRERAGVVKG